MTETDRDRERYRCIDKYRDVHREKERQRKGKNGERQKLWK